MQTTTTLFDQRTCRVFYGCSEPDLFRRISRLRFEVWNDELHDAGSLFPDGIWRDESDPVSHHWALLDAESNLVATTRLTMSAGFEELPEAEWYTDPRFIPGGPIAYLSREVVAKSHRRRGISEFLIHEQLRWARELKARTVLLRAIPGGSGFFLKLGFELVQPPKPGFTIRQIEFSTFALDLTDPAALPR